MIGFFGSRRKADDEVTAMVAESSDLKNGVGDIGGSRLLHVIEELVTKTKREVTSWLDATESLCLTSGEQYKEVLKQLALSNGKTIAADLSRLEKLLEGFNSNERRIVSLRSLYRNNKTGRASGRRNEVRESMEIADDIIARMMEAERSRSEIMGEVIRVAVRAEIGAKELYGQVSALSGHGTVESVAGLNDVPSIADYQKSKGATVEGDREYRNGHFLSINRLKGELGESVNEK